MRVSGKKIILIVIPVLILFGGIVALTQETDESLPDIDSEETEIALDIEFSQRDDWIRPPRWFRSNSGGMALEEMQSRFTALRNQYALAINYVSNEELPEYLLPYFDEKYNVEARILYKKGEQIRTQWILRDAKGNTRLNAVFIEPESVPDVKEETTELVTNEEKETESITLAEKEESEEGKPEEAKPEEGKPEEEAKVVINKDIKKRKGFIEIYDENLFLKSEYRFFEDGKTEKTEYMLKDNILVSAEYSLSDNDEDDFKASYIDYYRYNRFHYLRGIERIFYKDGVSVDPVIIAFPKHIIDSIKMDVFIGEKINVYPEFFEDDLINAGYKMIFDTDDRGRITSQTLYDDENKIVWTIKNTWKGNRIVKTVKTEGETVLTAEFAYNSDGDKILERNFKNGVLERIVSTEGKTEIEELYMNDLVVLRAVWEDGRKISETRVRN
ncbi:hypothetical protein R84B8_02712 [Treponema sp. R8-4-B8]